MTNIWNRFLLTVAGRSGRIPRAKDSVRRLALEKLDDRLVPAPVSYSQVGTTFTQTFDPNSPVALSGGGAEVAPGAYITPGALPAFGSGTSNAGGSYLFGTANTEVALGEIGSNSAGDRYIAIAVVNDTGAAQPNFTVGYTGEQWRRGSGQTGDNLGFSYRIAPAGTAITSAAITAGAYTPFAALTFNGPADGGGTNLDGNAAANRTVFAPTEINPAAPWQPGEVLILRWFGPNFSSTDDALAIDDFSFKVAQQTGSAGTFTLGAVPATAAENGGKATFTISRSSGSSGAVDVAYTVGGTASGSDYTSSQPITGIVSFADGETAKTFEITGVDDGDSEGDEALTLTLTSATNGGTLGAATAATITIQDDDPPQAQYFPLAGGNLTQDWSNKGLIAANDDWSGVTSIRGFLTAAGATGGDPQTALGASLTLDVNANQTNPLTFTTGGVTEFELADPAVAVFGSGSALAPNLVAYLDTTGQAGVTVSYRLRDLETDAAGDDAVQAVALQYRIGSIGDYINIPDAFVADATSKGPGADISKSITLPAAANNQSRVEIRWVTGNAGGNDEAVGIDDIVVGTAAAGPGVFAFSQAAYSVAENGGTVSVQIARTGGSSGAADVAYAVSGTADAADYTADPALTGTVSFGDGETLKTILITGVNDAASEGDETLVLTLTGATGGGTVGPVAAATVTVTDDDAPQSQYFPLAGGNFTQNWTDTGLIAANDNWSGVTSVRGFLTVAGAVGSGGNPQTALGVSQTLDVNANQTNPNAFQTGGVTEFELVDPTIALAGSNSAVAPNLVVYLDTTGKSGIQVAYTVRDLEDGTDDAIQPVSLQYRLGSSGDYVDVPEAFIADATVGGATQATSKLITLPAAVDNQAQLELRWVTFNAAGNDEAVGIDDIVVSAGPGGGGTLTVVGLNPTPSGFEFTFSEAIDPAALNLYSSNGALGAADVTLTGPNGPVIGTLVVRTDRLGATFLQTGPVNLPGNPNGGTEPGTLPAGSYTVTLRSAADGFKATDGDLLDGDANGTAGGNYVAGFTVSAPALNARTISLPDFARGPGNAVSVPNNGAQFGIPVILSNGLGVGSVQFSISYDRTLLNITGFTPTVAGATPTFNPDNNGLASLSLFTAGQFSATAGPIVIGYLTANVPDSAATAELYGKKHVLDILSGGATGLRIFDTAAAALPAVADDAVHMNVYVGDLNGDSFVDSADAQLMAQTGVGLLTGGGVDAYPNADVNVPGDTNNDVFTDAGDAQQAAQAGVGLSVPSIPDQTFAGTFLPDAAGPDPRLFVGVPRTGSPTGPDLVGAAQPGTTIYIPIRLEVTEAGGINLDNIQVQFTYDRTRLQAISLAISQFLADNGFGAPTVNLNDVDAATGRASASSFRITGTTPLAQGTIIDLFLITFTVPAAAPNGSAFLDIENFIGTASVRTVLRGNGAQLTLIPAPTNGSTDANVDSSVQIGAAAQPGTVGFVATAIPAGEGAGTVTLTVRRTGGSAGAISAQFAVTGGTATGADYVLASGSVSWADGETADKTIVLTLVDDALVESSETVIVSLSAPTGGATLTAGAEAATVTIADNDALTVGGLSVNGGAVQRSRVTTVSLTFSGTVSVSAANFALTNTTTGSAFPGTIVVSTQVIGGQTVVTLTFAGIGTESGSLADGRYSLLVTGVAGLTGNAQFAFHRLFGDGDGDADVDGRDQAAFRAALGTSPAGGSPYDFDGDGDVDLVDNDEFRRRLGKRV